MVPSNELLKSIKSDIESGTITTPEYSDFILMKVWGCTPKEFDEQDEYMILLHKRIISEENLYEWKESKRASQKSKF